jgi:hypothetical protein
MVDMAIAQMQIQRLDATTDFHWKNKEARKELVTVLRKHARSNMEAQLAINAWLSESSVCPTPAQLIAAILNVRRAENVIVAGCPNCKGTGFVIVEQLCTPTDGPVLVQDLPGGWREAHAIRQQWRQEREDWLAMNPRGHYRPPNQQYLATAARKCGCKR